MTVKNADGILPGFNKVAVGTAARRRMSGVIAGLPVGGPYTVTLQIAGTAEKAVYRKKHKISYFDVRSSAHICSSEAKCGYCGTIRVIQK